MYNFGQFSDMDYRISRAKTHAPKDILTKTAAFLVGVITTVMVVLAPLQMLTTAVGGLLIVITFGVLLLVFTILWWPFLILLLGTSWLWLHAWYLRPILLVPGVLIATLAHLYVMLAPEPEKDAKYAKFSMVGEWPLSWYLIKPPAEYYREQAIEDFANAEVPAPAPASKTPKRRIKEGRVTISDSLLETALRTALDKPEGPIYKSDLESLITLPNLGGNNISDISALSGLTNLETLDLDDNNISDISALSGLTNLVELGLQENNIGDISALSGLTNLERLYLYDNPLSQNAINIHIPELEARGVSVNR